MSPTSLLCACSVSELLAGLSSGAVSAEEILNSCLGRIRLREAEVKAWAYLDSDNGFAAKKALSRNKKNEKLRGIPFAAKDVFEVASTPKSYGSQLYAAEISKRSSSVVDTLVAAGAVFLGKTVTAEFALYKPGATCNPHNIEHTPGGSSSGSAAAVADCQAPIALGTQTAGSIVRPASYCGVIGYKPTLGRYSTTGVLETSPTLDTVGFFCRSAKDASLVDEVLAEREPVDATGEDPHKFTVGIYQHQSITEASPAVRAAMEVVETKFPIEKFDVRQVKSNSRFLDLNNIHKIVHAFEARRSLLSLEGFQISNVGSLTKEFLDSAQSISESEYDDALGRLLQLRERSLEVFEGCDVLVAPAAPDYAPRGVEGTGDPVFNRMWTALGVPCAAFPVIQLPGSLPLGLTLIGRPDEDQKLLKILQLMTP